MDEFLEVIKGIDWDLLHRQKYEIIQMISDHEKVLGTKLEVEGLVFLVDQLQDVAAKLRMWEFPEIEKEN